MGCFCLCLTACQYIDNLFREREQEKYVARVGSAYLSMKELEQRMSGIENYQKTDSAVFANKIVSSWVMQQILLQKASDNLGLSDAFFQQQVQDYKNSLIIYAYQNQVLNKLLDTVVSEKEIEDYYRKNQQSFVLKSSIVKVRFAKVQVNNPKLKQIKQGIFSLDLDEKELKNLGVLCEKNAENFMLDGENWIFFNDLLKEIPIKTYNQEEFLKNNRNIEVVYQQWIYYLHIIDFKVRDTYSPIEFEKERIRSILLNLRKNNLLHEMNVDLMEEALQSGNVEYFQGE